MDKSLSSRGLKASNTVMRVDLDISFEALNNQYDGIKNPEGVFPLSIAENRLNWDILKSKFKSISSTNDIDDWVMGYTSPLGAPEFRESVASFYESYLTQCPIDPDTIGCSPGATGIVEMTSLLLADKGEVAVMPAPCYPVYRQDMENIGNVLRHDIITHRQLIELQHGPLLDLQHLENAKQELAAQDKTFKILILTSPDNPTGLMYSETHVREIADWCIKHSIHLVVNEIYALSRILISDPTIKDDYQGDDKFISFAKIMYEKQSDFLHHWYSFSKDFGISGFRLGIVHSYHTLFIKAYENYNLSHSVSNHTQWLVMHMIQDTDFLDDYIRINQENLTRSYVAVVKVLKKHAIPYSPSRGGLFVWADFSDYLSENTQEAEMDFWMKMFNSIGVLFTPGHGFGHEGYGFFRIVYPYISYENLIVALERLDNFLDRSV